MAGTEPANDPRTDPPDAPVPTHLYRSREVVQILGISRRQLQYWAQTDLVSPSIRTQGGHHRYTFDDLVALKATKRLIDAGVSVQKIRKSVLALRRLLPDIGRPLCELVLVATGDVVLVFGQDTVFEAITGQEWVFEVAEFEREVNAWRTLRDEDPRRRPRRVAPSNPQREGAVRRESESDWSETA